ncbi:MAG: nucleoside deaminase [Bacteroidales bacterium]|nr:nucleoside deaminase [Bacteroidales bacterium]
MTHEAYLKLAIEEAAEGMRKGDGGPFGAVIIRDGSMIGKGHNTVLRSHDPTAHAEVNAIRNACKAAGSHHLTGAVIYTNFEPCPMCLAAIYWADIRTLFYSADRKEAQKIGFMDNHLYSEFTLPEDKREVSSTRIEMNEISHLLEEWDSMEDKIIY